jgi:hypothetical protein
MAEQSVINEEQAMVTELEQSWLYEPFSEGRARAELSVVREGLNLAHLNVELMDESGVFVARGSCVLELTRPSRLFSNARLDLTSGFPPVLPSKTDCEMYDDGLGI